VSTSSCMRRSSAAERGNTIPSEGSDVVSAPA
jgi:hypothetical protein